MENIQNKKQQTKAEFLLAAGLVVIGISSRLLFNAIHFYNFNAITAAAIFGGAYLGRTRLGILVPVITLLISDAILGFYGINYMAVVYGSFILAFLVGKYYAVRPSFLRYIGVTLGGSLTFFLVTNFALWPFYTTLYPHTFAGVIQSYTAALPFYKNSLMSDLIFTAVLFGGFEMAKVFLPQPKKEIVLN